MQNLLKTILVLLMLTPLHSYAETPAETPPAAIVIPENHFGDGNHPGGNPKEINTTWSNIFTEKNCKATLQQFPFERAVDQNNKFLRATQTANGVSGIPKYEISPASQSPRYAEITPSPDNLESNPDQLKRLVAPCQCFATFQGLKQLNSIFSKELRTVINEVDRQTAIQEKKTRLQKRYWIEDHLLSQNSMCKVINVVRTSGPEPSSSTSTSSPSRSSSTTTASTSTPKSFINYCIYKKTDVDNLPEIIRSFKTLIENDFNKSCTVNTKAEECQVKLKAAQQYCVSNPSTPPATLSEFLAGEGSYKTGRYTDGGEEETIPIKMICQNTRYYGCLEGNKPEYLNIEPGFTSESLNINTVLNTKGQKGFQVIEDQGAGENNPAINFILYIINTLSNLSFLVSVFFLIMGGFYLVIASGNSEMTDKGKTAIKNFIFAITFTLLSYTIVVIIRTLLYS